MKIDIMISAADIKPERLKGKVVVVIDVLRATTVMITAINNGCEKVIPVREIEDALHIANKNREYSLLGGEREGLKIEEFDFSNSPLDYTAEVVKGKTLIMTTSNGTRAIKNSEEADRIFIAAMINGNAVAKKLVELNKDVVFINAGTNGEFSMDDFITSGYIINCIKSMGGSEHDLTDMAITSEYVYKGNPGIISFVKDALHYKRLKDLGFYEDLRYCLTKDIVDIVPEYKAGEIIL
ncbi:MAG: 2-phosphosulfolactate phosphatase family protein [Clostridium sp.]|uniref:2-phosphosulfolactate phosphatase family protein n=1 Tax=Clostridium sp. TaxID=1506 RepID=UPI0030567987